MPGRHSQKFPLELAYPFMETHGLAEEAVAIRQMKAQLGSYTSTIRRGRVIEALERNALLDLFIRDDWPPGLTREGQRQIQSCVNVYRRFLEGQGDARAAEASTSRQATAQHDPSPARPRRSTTIAEVVRSEEPFSNLMKLRGLVRTAEQYIWWADRYFNTRGLEELVVSLEPGAVREVRILSGEDRIDDRTKRDFLRFRRELRDKGVSAEWRILRRFPHDRFIISATFSVNVPSIDTIVRGHYAEMLETPNRPPFEQWWSGAHPL